MYTLVDTPDTLGESVRYFYTRTGVPLSLDTETTGLDWLRCRVFLFAISDGVRTFVCPVTPNRYEMYLEVLNELFNVQKHPIICHNIKFDMHMLQSTFGFECLDTQWHDTKLMAYLLDENRQTGLKSLMTSILQWHDNEAQEISDYFKKNKIKKESRDYSKLPTELLYTYVAKDSYSAHKLFTKFSPSIEHYFKVLYERECKILKILYKMEKNGLPIDEQYLNWYTDNLADTVRVEKEALETESNININSTQQMGEYLTKKLKIKITAITEKTGKPKVNVESLKELDHPFVTKFLAYRKDKKLLSTYLEPYCKKVYNGKIHGSYMITGTKTGRFSSHAPNIQNIPKNERVKRMFITEPGQEMYFWDQSQIEMVGFVFYSQEPKMLKLFREGTDIYFMTAKEVLGRDPTPQERQTFKAVNLSLIYGVGKEKLVAYFKMQGIDISRAEAIQLREDYFTRFPGVKPFHHKVMNTVKQNRQPWGHYIKNTFGRVRRLDPYLSYTGINHLIQGWAADLIKDSMVRIEEKYYPIWRQQLHDSIRLDFPLKMEGKDAILKGIEYELTNFPNVNVPIRVKRESSRTNWSEAK